MSRPASTWQCACLSFLPGLNGALWTAGGGLVPGLSDRVRIFSTQYLHQLLHSEHHDGFTAFSFRDICAVKCGWLVPFSEGCGKLWGHFVAVMMVETTGTL